MEETQVGSSSGYDVFINFRGEDTRNTFVGHLYRALKGRGIRAFIDSKDLRKGEDIDYLLNVIRGCELSIAVFSQRYAESRWCLKELSQMLEAHTIILPIFFKVEPWDVKNQTGCFEISPLTHTNEAPETLSRWKNALRAAGDKSGRVFHDGENESELVDQVVEDAWSRLNKASLIDVKNSVGLESRVQHVLSLMFDDNSEDVQFLGICGEGGIGKTTVATTVYNRISKSFSKSCFLENVRAHESSRPDGLVSLQEKLLYSAIGVETKICSSKEGSQKIKERFQNTKTLLVLDDVDNQTQLNALARDPNWFGSKSRIIVTTRDWSVLSAVPEKNRKIHEHEELNQQESLKLFSLHAFSTDEPPDNFMQLSLDIACTTGGLPLALEVLGSELSMNKEEEDKPLWESMLRMLQQIPHNAVFEKLKISFDSLNEIEKAMFLDVACLFIGWAEETVISIWEACGFEPRCRMEVLKRKSLLKIRNEMFIKELWMHDQIRDMGRRITYNQEPNNPHKHSRLWSFNDTMKVLRSDKGNEMVEVIFIPDHVRLRKKEEDHIPLSLQTKDFEMMPRLRVLKIGDEVTMEGSFQHLPPELRWLQWYRCPLEKLSANSYHDNLFMLDLSFGRFRQAWKNWRESKRFEQLKVLRLSYCESLSQSPDFSGFPHLERLYLDHCRSLVTLHESIGELQQLVFLNLEFCKSLKKLPNNKSIGELQQLVYLNLERCSSLKELPNNICRMTSLRNLILKGCRSLKTLPGSIGELKESLVELSLDGTNIKALPDGVAVLEKLEVLSIGNNRALMYLPKLGNLTSLCKLLVSPTYENLVDISVLYALIEGGLGNMKSMKKLEELNLGYFCVKTERFRGSVQTRNIKSWYLISKMGRSSSVVTNQRSWQRQDQQAGTSLGSSIEKWREIWIPLISTYRGGNWWSYLIPDDIDEIGACRSLVMHVSLNTCLSEDMTHVEFSEKDISLTFDSYVHMKAGNKIAYKVGLAIEHSRKSIRPGEVEYIHEFKGFDWFGVQLEGNDAIEILDVKEVSCLKVSGVSLYLVKEGSMFDSHQFSTESQSSFYSDKRCFEMVRYAPTEDEDKYHNHSSEEEQESADETIGCMIL